MRWSVVGLVTATFVVSACGAHAGDGRVVAPPTHRVADEVLEPVAEVTSPDGGLTMTFGLLEGGSLAHRISRVDERGERMIVEVSPVGLDTSDGSFLDGLEVVELGASTAWSSEFDLPTGKRRQSELAGTARTLRFASAHSDLLLEVDIVVVDDGAAYRTRLIAPDVEDLSDRVVTVLAERAVFDLDVSSTAWLQPHDQPGSFTPAYERIVLPGRSLERPIPSRVGWTLPALVESDRDWTMLAEAGLGRGWAGSRLGPAVADGTLSLAFPEPGEGLGVGQPQPSGPLPLTSPWRVVMTSTDLAELVGSDLVRHLAPEADDRDWSWVEPGRVSWSWWADNESTTDPDRLIEYLDLAAEFGWEYSLIDANWNELDDADLRRVVDHANSVGVGLLLWYNSGGRHNEVTEAPRGLMSDPDTRRAEMQRISELGIRGIKVDFFHSDKPDRIAQYLDILADAADAELLVNFHGSTVPRGWSRTWPNLMTMEAVAGGEQYLFDRAYPNLAPGQNTVLPFMRNVIGSMDYTPTTFDEQLPRSTSNAHELALAIVFESGLLHFIDTPEIYRAQPSAVREVLATVPAAWDDSVLLDGRPDSHVVMARRSGDRWWIGAINGPAAPVDLSLAGLLQTARLEGLADGTAEVVSVCDGEDSRSWSIERSVGAPDRLTMPASGGCVFVVEPA